MFIAELPYREDSAGLFSHWSREPWAVFLDSNHSHTPQGRYDIIAVRPRTTLVTRGHLTEVRDGEGIRLSPEDPFCLVKQALGETHAVESLPFSGGAIGFFSYDLARRLERLPSIARETESIPEMAVGIYDWAIVTDHRSKKSFLAGRDNTATRAAWREIMTVLRQPRPRPAGGFRLHSAIRSDMSWPDYRHAFERIQHYIHEGDCYQVNFAQRFAALASGDPWRAYLDLRQTNPAPFGAFLRLPQLTILSSSPERFLKVRESKVETKPIKGTRPRGMTPEEDFYLIEALSESIKDRAENLMIVDLLRNDLSKNCRLGSVKVPKLFEVETFATVHHLVSTVVGELEPGRHALDLLRGCFPGGSITGAPKIRAMEIIEELENSRRGVYCGSIGYIGFDGGMDTNIAIRTLVHANNSIHFWAGGGIVADSDARREYQESFDKAAALIQVLSKFQLASDRVGG